MSRLHQLVAALRSSDCSLSQAYLVDRRECYFSPALSLTFPTVAGLLYSVVLQTAVADPATSFRLRRVEFHVEFRVTRISTQRIFL